MFQILSSQIRLLLIFSLLYFLSCTSSSEDLEETVPLKSSSSIVELPDSCRVSQGDVFLIQNIQPIPGEQWDVAIQIEIEKNLIVDATFVFEYIAKEGWNYWVESGNEQVQFQENFYPLYFNDDGTISDDMLHNFSVGVIKDGEFQFLLNVNYRYLTSQYGVTDILALANRSCI